MSTVGFINVSLEIWGCIFALIVVLCQCIGGHLHTKLDRPFILMLLCSAVILASVAAAWLFKGLTDVVGFYAVRIANFLVFALGYVMLTFFYRLFARMLKPAGNCFPPAAPGDSVHLRRRAGDRGHLAV